MTVEVGASESALKSKARAIYYWYQEWLRKNVEPENDARAQKSPTAQPSANSTANSEEI